LVFTTAGATALTRMRGLRSTASSWVSRISAALLTPYIPMLVEVRMPAIEATLTIAPPCSLI